jgi:transcriptional regulator with XRE-family HTH domain
MSPFHVNLLKLMDDHEVSVATLSEEIGVSQVTIYHWKAGDRLPKSDNLMKLAEYFYLDMEDLLGGAKQETASLQ